jgi:hypothetical protein
VTLRNKTYFSEFPAVQGGGTLKICSEDDFDHSPYGGLIEGQGPFIEATPPRAVCKTFPVPANPTGKIVHLELFDNLHPRERMVLAVLPR